MDKETLDKIIEDLKKFNWNKTLDYCNTLPPEFNRSQWRFIKGTIVEKAAEIHSKDNTFKYINEVHRDYRWEKHNLDVELKSKMAGSFYNTNKQLKPNLTFILTNTYEDNNATELANPADILIGVASDGVIMVPKEIFTAPGILNPHKAGFTTIIPKDKIIEITGYVEPKKDGEKSQLFNRIMAAIEEDIRSFA
jgi:hypothetical protein